MRDYCRYCPEIFEIVSEQDCQACEKYRHWPEGTDDEPRECWYDWKANQPLADSEEDDI